MTFAMLKTALASVLCLTLAYSVLAQTNPVIASFGQNGTLIATNLHPGTIATVEWSPSLNGPWATNWSGLEAVVVDGDGKIQVSVPMFYRVVGVPREPVGIEANTTNVVVGENSTATFSVRLTAQPPANVTVTVTSANPAKATVSPSTLSFTTANWDTYQTVTLTGVNDADAMEVTTSVTLSATGMYDRMVGVFVVDDDQALVLSVSSLIVTEGSTANIGVRLAGQPAGSVTVSLLSGNTAVATVLPGSMTFTPANWNINQLAAVTGARDANTANAGTVVQFNSNLTFPASVLVSVNDDDVPAIESSVNAVTVLEGGSGAVQVRLAFMPAANVTVNAGVSDTSKATASPATLTFTPANYNTYQALTVNGGPDANNTHEVATLSLTAPFHTPKNVTINVTDDD